MRSVSPPCSMPFRCACIRAHSVFWAIAACWLLWPSIQNAVAYTPVTNSQLQAVNSDGSNAWPGAVQPYPVSLIGVVVNNPADMLDYRTRPRRRNGRYSYKPCRAASTAVRPSLPAISAAPLCT